MNNPVSRVEDTEAAAGADTPGAVESARHTEIPAQDGRAAVGAAEPGKAGRRAEPRWREWRSWREVRLGPAAVPYLFAAAFFAVYATYALLKHRRMETHAYDLGLFEQVVRNYAHFQAPVSDIRDPGFNVLGEHFHPILALLGPVYRVFPGPGTLLVAQSLLIALSVIPMTRIGMRAFGNLGGAAFGIAYGLAWGLQSAVAFEFHEICFAVPMIAFGLERFLLGKYGTGLLWLLPLVLVKEDLSLTIAAAGVYLAVRRQWKWAAIAVGVGIVAFVVVVFVILPAINPTGTYPFWGNLDGTTRAGNAVPGTGADKVPLTKLVLGLPADMLFPSVKWMTLFTLLVPTGFLALRSPILIMVLPTLLWRFTSSNEFYWGVFFHYSAVLMPIVFAAFVDAVVKLRTSKVDWLRRYAAKAVIVPLAVSLALCRDFPLMDLLHKPTWTVDEKVKRAEQLVGKIPDDANVSSTERLAPRLTSRARVTNFPTVLPGPGWIAIDDWDGKEEWARTWIAHLEGQGFTRVASGKGVVILQRTAMIG
ncbi:DUF2079 domain-containing protein [Yinghuangia soli]|uniref:DUF2079 domain-containing protein n=1 Tax=Yinghuangia soli TaxID=2908204 RepID=A0AA41Q0B4_9ACTN|nr:DUF2079 domain-containing protein [Yinghuangia soli]MCF2528620.1 DUF2079 domain-containing protein [Yinghuangia soli]